MDGRQPIGPGRGRKVAPCLLGGVGINLHRINRGGAALRQHQGNHARASAHVEGAAARAHLRPRAQQHTVGAHLHGGQLLVHRELLEAEIAVRHALLLDGQEHAQRHPKECGKQRLEIDGQQEADGVRRNPEQRYGAGKHKAPLHQPVDVVVHDVAHGDWPQQRRQAAIVLRYVDVGDFVHGHHYWGKNHVHGRAYGQRNEHLFGADGLGHSGCRALNAHVLHERRHTLGEQHKGHFDGQSQHAPHHGAGQDTESGVVVHARADAQPNALAKGGQHGEFNEAGNHAVLRVEVDVGIVNGLAHKERQQQRNGAKNYNYVGAFHYLGKLLLFKYFVHVGI